MMDFKSIAINFRITNPKEPIEPGRHIEFAICSPAALPDLQSGSNIQRIYNPKYFILPDIYNRNYPIFIAIQLKPR